MGAGIVGGDHETIGSGELVGCVLRVDGGQSAGNIGASDERDVWRQRRRGTGPNAARDLADSCGETGQAAGFGCGEVVVGKAACNAVQAFAKPGAGSGGGDGSGTGGASGGRLHSEF